MPWALELSKTISCPAPNLLQHKHCLLFADFNENGFIDEEDLQKIVLRLLNSDDVSEDLLMDLIQHARTQRVKGRTWDPDLSPKATQMSVCLLGRRPRATPKTDDTLTFEHGVGSPRYPKKQT